VFTPYAEAGGLLASSAPEIQASCNLVCCIEPVLENSSDQFGGDGTLAKPARTLDLALGPRLNKSPLTRWLYEEMRRAILERRLPPGTRLPPTRDLAAQFRVSRGVVVTAFDQLREEGYLTARVGAGTHVCANLPANPSIRVNRVRRIQNLPAAIRGLSRSRPPRPFRAYEPELTEFPTDVWARVASRRLRRASAALLGAGHPAGYEPLRQEIAAYLGSSRGVNCSADSVVILSGVQQGLDLFSRLLLKPGQAVWLENPGYFGAAAAFRNQGANIIPVPVDEHGLDVAAGLRLGRDARAAYVTPAHQFPLGALLSLDRRLALLAWAHEANAFILEDDYDSEYRFEGHPISALQGLDTRESVIFLGSFNKVLFPSLRLGFAVVPPILLDRVLALRLRSDVSPPGPAQAILCDFIAEGHLGRHIRRMRNLYAGRLEALREAAYKYLAGVLEISSIRAGLSTAGILRNGMTSREAEILATANGIEVLGFHRFFLGDNTTEGLLMGFAGFTEREIRRGVRALAKALESTHSCGARAQPVVTTKCS
jgi:GntR family transcriptional regulator / MocR family aminotransferase